MRLRKGSNKVITNKRQLAVTLSNSGRVELSKVSKRLNKIVELWLSRKEIKIENNFIVGAF
jgi:hypothetical protein